MSSDLDRAMREASDCRTVTDTDSCAFSFFNQSNADEGMTEAHKHLNTMRKLLSLALIFVTMSAGARQINPDEAANIASEFLNSSVSAQSSIKRIGVHRAKESNSVLSENAPRPYYVFNAEDDKGFVIVSGDDRAKPILGYSYSGTFNHSFIPDNVQYLLNSYTKLIESLPEGTSSYALPQSGEVQSKIIKTANWNQGDPYNRKCPVNENGVHYVTGCVPTATAIIMKSHCWPPTGIGEFDYSIDGEIFHVDFRDRIYNWDKMPDDIDENNCPDDVADEVSQLMADVGYASWAKYGVPGGTGASPDFAMGALVKAFGYTPTILNISRANCDGEFFMNIIKREIDNGRTLLIDSSNTPNENIYAHAYVADGYDEAGNVHFNFGWGGSFNGFYTIDVAESFAGVDIMAYYGIQPDNAKKEDIPVDVVYVNRNHFRHISDNTINCHLWWIEGRTDYSYVSYGYAAKNVNTGEITIFEKERAKKYANPYNVNIIQVDEDIEDGDYIIYPVSRADDGEWLTCPCNEYYQSHVELTVSNGQKIFHNPGPACNDIDKGKVEIDGIIYKLNDTNLTAEVTYRNSGFNSYSGDVTVPSIICYNGKDYQVTVIGEKAFAECNLGKVTLPPTIREIGSGAFSAYMNEINLEDLVNLEVLTGWGISIYGNYTKKIVLPPNIKAIQTYAIQVGGYCATILDIPESVEEIYGSPFPSIQLIALKVNWTDPAKVTTFGPKTFENSSSLHTIYVPKGTKEKYEALAPWNLYEIIEVPDDIIPVEKIEVVYGGSVIQENDIVDMTPGLPISFDVNVIPENATFKDVSWQSDVVSGHRVQRVGNSYQSLYPSGEYGIHPSKFVAIDDSGKEMEFSLNVVNPAIKLLQESYTVTEGECVDIEYSVTPYNAALSVADLDLRWYSSDENIVAINRSAYSPENFSLSINAIVPGTVTLRANSSFGILGTCEITVNPKVIQVEEIRLNFSNLILKVGECATLSATVLPENATDKSVTWSSSEETVAAVDGDGSITAISLGNAVITATSGDVSASCTVEVVPIPVESVTLDYENVELRVGESIALTATVMPENATDKSLTWTSSDENIAQVDNAGNVTMLKNGICIITAKANDASGIEAQCTVSGTSAIESLFADGETEVDVYDVSGTLIMKGCDKNRLKQLTPGFYIIRKGSRIFKILLH